jgi:hypothetical protein
MDHQNLSKISFFSQVLILFSVNILFLCLTASVVGDDAGEISSMYQFGSKGLAITTILEFLLSSFVVISLKTLFFSDKLFKCMLTLWRTVLLLFSILVFMVLFIILFDWFPINSLYSWTGFFICFGGGFIISSAFMIIKTKMENSKYEEQLSHYKNQHGGKDDNE